MITIATFAHNGYTATLFQDIKSKKFGYIIRDAQGDLYAQGKGRKTENDACEECLFELHHAD